jgi:hypothetical protein
MLGVVVGHRRVSSAVSEAGTSGLTGFRGLDLL